MPAGWHFNTAPDKTTVDIALGSGRNVVTHDECSGTITAGTGFNEISLVDGHNSLILGGDVAHMMIAAHNFAAAEAWAADRASTTAVQIGSGHVDMTIDDSVGNMTPLTTLVFLDRQTGGGTTDAADVIRYGCGAGAAFVGGDWRALTLDLLGFTAGSTVPLRPAGDHMQLEIQDKAGGPPDVLSLYGASSASISDLHLHFL